MMRTKYLSRFFCQMPWCDALLCAEPIQWPLRTNSVDGLTMLSWSNVLSRVDRPIITWMDFDLVFANCTNAGLGSCVHWIQFQFTMLFLKLFIRQHASLCFGMPHKNLLLELILEREQKPYNGYFLNQEFSSSVFTCFWQRYADDRQTVQCL